MEYKVYRLTSPSKRSYIGFTSQKVTTRWLQHCGEARRGKKHPLQSAIRKYGPEDFRVETLSIFNTEEEAFKEEIRLISLTPNAYNLSKGGGHDSVAGVQRMRELLADPEWKAAYSKKLSFSIRNSEKYKAAIPHITARLKEWRLSHPKEAHKAQRRITRLAAKKCRGKKPWNYGKKHSLLSRQKMSTSQKMSQKRYTPAQKKKLEILRRKNSTSMWLERTDVHSQKIASKISRSVTAFHASKNTAEKKKHDLQLAEARRSIDHGLRKTRQREALQKYWTPERRAAKSLEVKKGENYANVRHNQFGSTK